MIDSELEIETFKRAIDLRAYAAAQGYQLDRKESWRGSAVMRHASGDKVVIKRGGDGRYVYFSVRDDRDNGTIIDFVQNRERVNLGAVRKALRPWIGEPPVPVPVFAPLQATLKDRTKVEAAYARMESAADGHPYLEQARALPRALLQLERFEGRIRRQPVDNVKYPNAVFPHFDREGLCGYEIKNERFTGFAPGGTKGLWLSCEESFDNTLVFSESAIDALSYAALFPDERARYASIGGKMNPEQPALIHAAILRLPKYARVVAAMDADAEGGKLADLVREQVSRSGRDDVVYVFEQPLGFKDWNDQLCARPEPALPLRHKEAAPQ